ncbi:hypothetical protein ID47_11865 [Candidatus Paracaedibacter acanthamoebae]|uniref:Uncharacterized protein n=1 Tax=Candidatus Odyssella acanthamoebae TaxID=91604 RepID=A0A077B2P8_9PROT|nr:hypothetical protein ID47_11865 [Candidatus Paracaedibacter acanthamoebae]
MGETNSLAANRFQENHHFSSQSVINRTWTIIVRNVGQIVTITIPTNRIPASVSIPSHPPFLLPAPSG